ncbi:protein hunchback [Aricia agestis]|uniref:protein hunchback n=1 Tax=Aricia agestis TaxID=91739 RepID=UPI001C2090D5|nr:protein hunchback [Aricia agestis]
MLSYASPTGMLPATHAHGASWGSLLPPSSVIKSEPMDDENYSKEQSSGFFSEDFQSTSPSSSKESNERSPPSNGEPLPYYDNLSLHAKMNLGVHLENYSGIPFNLLTPPGFENRSNDDCDQRGDYEAHTPKSLVPPHVSTPLQHADATPPKSPRTSSPDAENDRRHFGRYHDSGFEGMDQNKIDSEDGHDGSGPEDDFDEEPGLRVPAVNSHGKVKTFKCKQCEFVAVTKLSFWEHSKEHIKPEKMLCCQKCPFVTEYKHHLEYHMRNHLGSKPFQCSQCSYSCVNKSMLNSHLKSHSNIYQYRCADCNYATKYCHSLKLHLRKYKHNPAMVLNMDGTPNPLPIIDVYGTRRGPKQKPMTKMFEQPPINNKIPPPPTSGHPIFGHHFPVNLPYIPPFLQHSFMFPPSNKYDARLSPNQNESTPEKQDAVPQTIMQKRLSGERPTDASVTPPLAKSPMTAPQTPTQRSVTPVQGHDALDLTSTMKTTEPASSPSRAERQQPVTPTTSLKNRRKGPAFKLQPVALRLQHQDSKMENDASDCESEKSTEVSGSEQSTKHKCQYCDITFGDLTMHTIHMGFHGYNDPFMCNKCGERSPDRVAFFIHLGLAQHA